MNPKRRKHSSSGSSSNSFENNKVSSTNDNSEQWEPKPWLTSSGSSLNVTLTPTKHQRAVGFKRKQPLDCQASRLKRGGFFGRLRKGFGYKKRSFRNQKDLRNGDEDFLVKQAIGDSPIRLNNSASVPQTFSGKQPGEGERPLEKIEQSAQKRQSQPGSEFVHRCEEKAALGAGEHFGNSVFYQAESLQHEDQARNDSEAGNGQGSELREWSSAARIAEALRCVQLLDERHCLKLIQSLRADLRLRATYLRYLVSSKQELLFTEMYLNTLQDQIKHDRIQCEFYFASVCVREFLSEQEPLVMAFCDEFRRLSLADEKCDFLQNFYLRLFEIMNENKHWQDVLHKRDFLVKVTLERCIMSRVYFNAIYPNGDGDRDRDRWDYA
uniref:RABX5 catalytic core helical domain-containing protein n=1 Tax=Dendroctonus ponderosae TaxID=77166 RepID=A0AAR5NXM8_DENPD